MPIPETDANGNLPPGVHDATLDEVIERYGTGVRREKITTGLRVVVLSLRRLHVTEIWVDGSYVTDKLRPGDVDVIFSPPIPTDYGKWGILEPDPQKRLQLKKQYRVDLLPSQAVSDNFWRQPILNHFQIDKRDGSPKGIIRLVEGAEDEHQE